MSVLRWVDSEAGLDAMPPSTGRRVSGCGSRLRRSARHVSRGDLGGLELDRCFDGGPALFGAHVCDHRLLPPLFFHKTYQTNRFWQFIFAVLGNSAVQRGPLWWASHHRHHHRFADTDEDPHSPSRHGFW